MDTQVYTPFTKHNPALTASTNERDEQLLKVDDTLDRDDLALDLALPVGEMEGGLDRDWEGCECTALCGCL